MRLISIFLALGLNTALAADGPIGAPSAGATPKDAAAPAIAPTKATANDPPDTALAEAGRRIYMKGILPSGAPLRATREGGIVVSGAEVACFMCHRRSGLGSYEGTVIVPPIIGDALFARFRKPGERLPRRTHGMKFIDFDFHTRPPYDDKTLARAIREGVSTSGYQLRYLMPRFDLDDDAMGALIAYLRTLSAAPSPGVEPPYLHFATVITPDVDPQRRQAFLDTLKTCFDERNPVIKAGAGKLAEGAPTKRWQLHVWQLEGKPETWQAQLAAEYAKRPVFALLSGLGGDNWEPVHEYCAREKIPCLFPNVDVPGGSEDDFNFYMSRGVYLDAQVLARYLTDEAQRLGIRRVVQVAGPGRAEHESADALRRALKDAKIAVEQRPPSPDAGNVDAEGKHGFEDIGKGDALVLWLREADLAAFAQRLKEPPAGASIFASARLVEPERLPLVGAWRDSARLVYPYDAPGRWALRTGFNLKPWLSRHGLTPSDERLQGSVVTACGLLSEGLGRSQGILQREFFIETLEYLGDRSNAPATAPYPRFTLGPTQREGSKGAYIVRPGPMGSSDVKRDSDWIVP